MAYFNLLSKLDRALVAYLISKGVGTAADTVPGKASANKALPVTICWSERGVEAAPYSGTYVVTVSVIVKTAAPVDVNVGAEQPRLDSDARTAAVFDCFHADVDSAGDKLGADITTAARATSDADLADFTCENVKVTGLEAAFEEDADAWVETLGLEVVCCPSALEGQTLAVWTGSAQSGVVELPSGSNLRIKDGKIQLQSPDNDLWYDLVPRVMGGAVTPAMEGDGET